MARKYYDDQPETPSGPAADNAGNAGGEGEDQGESTQDQQKEGDEKEGETTLVPKSIFGGKEPEPGDTCEFKVVHDYGDEVELAYVRSNDQKEKGPAQPAMAQAFDRMDQMATQTPGEAG